MASSAAVVCEGIERSYGDNLAVAGVDLEVAHGEIYGFLGPNGAGKSTLVKVLCTLIAPTGGCARVLGHDVATEPDQVRLRIGVALQDAALDLKQTGTELLKLQGRLYGLTRAEADQRISEVRGLIDIGAALEQPIGTYSGGMKRRLDLAAALIHNPDLLFLDEPTTGLDPVSRLAVWAEVRRLNDELGMTIFLTTHYLEEADELADRVGIIDHGTLVAEGSPTELKRAIGSDVIVARVAGDSVGACDVVRRVPGVEKAEIHGDERTICTEDGSATLSPVAVALNGCGVQVKEPTPRTPTLKTGNPAAVNASFILFFPFAFLTTSFVPQEALTGWLSTIADYNPVTYLLAGLRSLIFVGWDTTALLKAIGAVALVGLLSQSLALAALRGRVARK